ncbi:MAG: hypothetical protein ACMG6E_01520, partial [Candidatus Roizmanbacteria bacterium]
GERLPNDITHIDVSELWPEIYDNDFLATEQYQQIIDTREVEKLTSVKAIITLISKCCNSDERGSGDDSLESSQESCTLEQSLTLLQEEGMFGDDSAFSQAKQHVCFHRGKGCLKPFGNKIIIPCAFEDGYCTIGNSLESPQLCMSYDEFLKLFAANGISGDIPGSAVGSEAEKVNSNVVLQIRNIWRKELRMMRRYLDIQRVY